MTDEERYERIIAGAAASVLDATDEEIEEEVRAAGEDPDEVAERLRQRLLDLVGRNRKSLIEQARERYERKVAAMRTRDYGLPRTPAGRALLLDAVLAAQPRYGSELTIQHRELEDLPDADVDSYLRQLAELGALEDFLDEDWDRR